MNRMALKIVHPPELMPTAEDIEREETVFDRDDADCDWGELRETAKTFAKEFGWKHPRYQERLDTGSKWHPYVLVTCGEDKLRVCGWNGMVEVMRSGEWDTLVPPQHGAAHWNGGGSALYFADGTFKFNVHGNKERKGSADYPVIEDLAGDEARELFPDRYVRLPDGREGISTEGLSKADLQHIMRETGHREADRGERFQQTNLKEWRADINRRLREGGFKEDWSGL